MFKDAREAGAVLHIDPAYIRMYADSRKSGLFEGKYTFRYAELALDEADPLSYEYVKKADVLAMLQEYLATGEPMPADVLVSDLTKLPPEEVRSVNTMCKHCVSFLPITVPAVRSGGPCQGRKHRSRRHLPGQQKPSLGIAVGSSTG